GRANDAEQDASEAAKRLRADGAADDEAAARAFLAVVLASVGRATDGEPELARARELVLVRRSQQPALRTEVAIAEARVQAAAGRTAQARAALRELVAGPAQSAPFELQMEARLQLGRILLASDPAGARREIASVARTAKAHGFLLLARAAETALRNEPMQP